MRDARFQLISLRPTGSHAGLRRAAARRGGRVLAMSPWAIAPRDDGQAQRELRDALACACIVFTSPAAVRAAAALQPLRAERGQHWFAVGEGTRLALQRAGVPDAQAPDRMDSEGLLALPGLAALQADDSVGLVTAPGGRGEITRQLQARGVRVVRADVYARVLAAIPSARWRALQRLLDDAASPAYLALSSGDALAEWLAQAPATLAGPLGGLRVIAASERLAMLARAQGFRRVTVAASARPADLLAAIDAA